MTSVIGTAHRRRESSMNKSRSRVLAAALPLTSVLAVTAACTGADMSAQTSPAAPRSAIAGSSEPSTAPADLSDLIRLADVANVSGPNTLITAGARPTVVESGGQATTMVIKDLAVSPVVAGRYRLVIYCAGEGTLYAELTAGAVTQVAEMPPCGSSAAVGTLEVEATATGSEMGVTIIPVGTTRAAVSYQVQGPTASTP